MYNHVYMCHGFNRRMHPADPAMDFTQSDSILNRKIIVKMKFAGHDDPHDVRYDVRRIALQSGQDMKNECPHNLQSACTGNARSRRSQRAFSATPLYNYCYVEHLCPPLEMEGHIGVWSELSVYRNHDAVRRCQGQLEIMEKVSSRLEDCDIP